MLSYCSVVMTGSAELPCLFAYQKLPVYTVRLAVSDLPEFLPSGWIFPL